MKLRSVFYLVLNASLIATGHILQKTVLNYGVDRLVFAFVRIATGFFLITLLLIGQRHNPIKVVQRNARHFVVLGVFFSGVGILLKLWGLSYTSATNASFIMSLSSVTAVIFAYFLLGEKARRSFYGIVMVMIFGVYLVSTKGESLIPQKGDLIILGLVFLIGFMQVYGKKVLKTMTVLETSFGRALFGMGFLGLMIPIVAPHSFSTIPNMKVLLLVMANGLTFSGSIMAFYKALQAEGASNSAMFALLVPVFTAFLGRVVLGETFTLVQLAGGLIILAGSMTISRIKVRQSNF